MLTDPSLRRVQTDSTKKKFLMKLNRLHVAVKSIAIGPTTPLSVLIIIAAFLHSWIVVGHHRLSARIVMVSLSSKIVVIVTWWIAVIYLRGSSSSYFHRGSSPFASWIIISSLVVFLSLMYVFV